MDRTSVVPIEIGGRLATIRVRSNSPRFLQRLDAGVVHEAGLVQQFAAAAHRASSFLDIGANIGWYGSLAVIANPAIDVTLVEPDSVSLRIAVANVWLNGGVTVKAVNVACGDVEREAWLVADAAGDSMLGHISFVKPGSASPSAPVRSTTVDAIVVGWRQPPDLVKIDVEGDEIEVARGMEALLRRAPAMFVEYHPGAMRAKGRDPVELFYLLEQFGYSIVALDKHSGHQISGRNQIPLDGNWMLLCHAGRY